MRFPLSVLILWSILFLASSLHFSVASNIDFASLSGLSGNFTAAARLSGLLNPRQKESCPAGLLQCPGDDYCCEPGFSCCGMPPTTCCTVASYCDSLIFPCCQQFANTCGGTACCIPDTICCPSSPLGCCPTGSSCCSSSTNPCCELGTSCCGDGCCQTGETCERGECIDETLKVARFEYNEPVNGNLLRHMCKGLQGKNTQKLTYSGPPGKDKDLLRQKAKKRRDAGCTRGFCKSTINNNGDPSLNSCDEWPPASSDEGGGTTSEQTVACVPSSEQSYQGGVMGPVLKKISKGDSFIISIDCDNVLGSVKREVISESMNEAPFLDAKLTGENDTLAGYFMISFGDLWAGSYSAKIQGTAGSTFGGFLQDNTGDNITVNPNALPAITSGHIQQFNFTLDYPVGGAGILLATHDKSSAFAWMLNGTTFENVTDASLDDTSNDSTSAATPSSTSPALNANIGSVGQPVLLAVVAFLVAIMLGLADNKY